MNYERAARRLLFAVFAWKLLYVFISPLQLVGDEAYYWDWSRRLDWGYLSKPPLIAWINAASTRLFGVSDAAVRIPAALCGLVSMWAVGALTRRLYGARAAFWAMGVWFALPLSAGSGLVMTIDAPLISLWALALLCTWRALEEPGPRWWIATALLVGIGLLAKQLMAVFFVILFAFLILSREDRRQLKTPWPYLVIVLPALMFVPVLMWNAEHGWVTATHTAEHFDRPGSGALMNVGEFIFGQIVIFSPIIWIQFFCLFVALLRRFRTQDRKTRFQLFFSAIPVAIFFLISLRQRVNANWPAVFYLAAVPMHTAWGLALLSGSASLDKWRPFYLRGIRLGYLFVFGAYVLPFFLPHTPIGGGKLDPTVRLRGWRETGEAVDALLAKQPRPDKTILVGAVRQDTALLAFYCKGNPRTYLWPGEMLTQYDLWPSPAEERRGWDALIFSHEELDLIAKSTGTFDSVEDLGWLEIPLGPDGTRRYRVYRGSGIRNWPGVGGKTASSASESR